MENEYSAMSLVALREIAKEKGVRATGLKKQELIDALAHLKASLVKELSSEQDMKKAPEQKKNRELCKVRKSASD